MSNTLDKIVQALPGDLSKAGIAEIHNLINEEIDSRAQAEVALLEARVSGFLRTKMEQLKTVALQELKASDETYRAVRIYEAVKHLVAGDITSADTDSIANAHAEKIASLEELVYDLKENLEGTMRENHILETKVNSAVSENEGLLSENLELIEQADLPFHSSESAVIITNETDNSNDFQTNAASDNHFLTEDVVRLSRTFTEDN
tara:strand:+ start:1660 stop:2274 length:615 start_codon:yes stop_codon:yes gene_type:complete